MSTERRHGEQVLEKPASETEHPRQWKVLIHNDDYTTMDFVVEVLETVFSLSPAEAYRIMMKVHTDGVGVAGMFPRDEAESLVDQVHALARAEDHPLRASLERE